MADKIEKIYVIRAEGSGAVIKDLRTINQLYKDLRKSAAELEAARRNTQDPAELARINQELQKIAQAETELATLNQSRLASARQEIQTNTQLIGTYEQLATGGLASIGAITNAETQMANATAASTAVLSEQATAVQTVSAAIAAGRVVEQQAVSTTMSEAEAQAALNAQYEQTKIEQAEVAAVTAEMNTLRGQSVAELATEQEAYIALSGQLALLKQDMATINAELALLNASYEAGTITETEYAAKAGALLETQNELRGQMSEMQVTLKNEAAAFNATANSINEARALVKQYTQERNDLNLLTAQGANRQRELNALIDQQNEFIRQSVDAYQQQKINIGNYPTLAAELRAVTQEMQRLALAGEQDSVAFKELTARSVQLTGAMTEVTTATKAAAAAQATQAAAAQATGSALVRTASRSFSLLRQLAYIIPGLGIAGIIGGISEALAAGGKFLINWATDADKTAKAAEDLARHLEEVKKETTEVNTAIGTAIGPLDTLFTRLNDTTQSTEDRNAAIAEIQKLYPEYFKNFSKEAILAGEATDAYLKLRDALAAKAAATVFQDRYNQALSKELDLTEEKDKLQKSLNELSKNASTVTTGPGGQQTFTFVKGSPDDKIVALREQIKTIDEQINEEGRKRIGYLEKIEDLTASTLKLLDKEKKVRVVDTSGKELQGANELAKATSKLRDQQIQEDIEANQEIFDNEKESLDARLLAYQNYQSDLIGQAENAAAEEIKIQQNLIDSIDKQLADKTKKRSDDEIKALKDRQAAAKVNITAASQGLAADIARINRQASQAAKDIVESDIKTRLKAIDDIRETSQEEGQARLTELQKSFEAGKISYKKFKEEEKRISNETLITELENIAAFLENQKAAFEAAGQDVTTLNSALQKINEQIRKATNQGFGDQAKHVFDLQDFYKKLKDTAIDAANTIGQAWVNSQQRQIDKDTQLKQTRLDNEKEARLAMAQSSEERLAIEGEFQTKQEALQKEAFERNKKLSMAQLGLEFAVASMKAINQALSIPGAGIFEALAAEAIVALEYATKLAVIAAQQFGAGGEVPTDGGQFGGRSHGAGGTDFMFKGRKFNAEADELAILNKRSSQSGTRYQVAGTTKQIASALNAAGGGVNFAPGATMGRFEYGGSLGSGLSAPYFIPASGLDAATLQKFVATIGEGFSSVNNRVDKLQVVVDPKAVLNANDRQSKYAKMGQL